MKSIDLNCDLGEGLLTDEQIIPLISSANIACGYHAGDTDTMKRTIELCMQHNVAVGAHPSWPDKENFGRTEMHKSAAEIIELLLEQLQLIDKTAKQLGATLTHVKPHGALYNQSAKDMVVAAAIADAVHTFNPSLVLFGLSGSLSITIAKQRGLQTANEVFADRTYTNEGNLTPRSQPNALIESIDAAVEQALLMVQKQKVMSVTGKPIHVTADTICLHGDGKHAVEFCKAIVDNLKQNHIDIKALV
ncbi:LamB/YcsF family protein [Lacibacter luteus]|uniref:LamB/YcsF family protein n=1 Tax=Lacibacter luteus TaxID=2508719 RepID=A0A4V1M806_9BACT|nr:5-oxoprolinase subunit PxpA [Lacibacter luteus]RXK62182.1 LamB/YcsF family protein [Lacibacter luteus]